MAYLNRVTLIGNIGKDPEIRVTTSGKKRVSIALATSRRYRDASGETREQTDWHNIVGWGKTADIFESLQLRKGTSLYVEGTLTYRSWEKDGRKQYATEIGLDNFQVLTPRGMANTGTRQAATDYAKTNAADVPSRAPANDAIEDLPF